MLVFSMAKIILFITLSIFSFNTLSQWTLVHEEEGINVYAGEYGKSGVIPFKATGLISSSVFNISKVIEDLDYKSEWAPKLKAVTVHERFSDNEMIFSEYYSTPWPARDREFLLRGKIIRHSEGDIEYIGHSIDSELKDHSHIQAIVKTLNFRLTKVSDNLTKITFEFNGDMQGWMPVWLMNLIQKKWPLRFIQGLREQVK